MNSATASSIALPIRSWPAPRSAGQYPMTVPACNRTYRDPTIALHLHEYTGTLWIRHTAIRLQPGDITLTPANTLSRYKLEESGIHFCIHFEPPSAAGKSARMHLPLHFRLGAQVAAAKEKFWHIIDYRRQADDSAEHQAAASVALLEFLLWLKLRGRASISATRSSRSEEALVKLRAAIDASLQKPLTVPELAAKTGLSADYIARLFNQRHGITIPRYLLLRRIELARHLLRTSDLTIQEVGWESGIPDPQYFNKQFRRIVGTSPSAFRQQANRRDRLHYSAPRR